MAKHGPIMIVEDDEDDVDLFRQVIAELKFINKIIWFNDCEEAFSYLKTTTDQPFIIISDVNLPKQSGLEFKRRIDTDIMLRRKSIPFIFYSTWISQPTIDEAYTELTVQGMFQKPSGFSEIKSQIKLMFDYWRVCKHPNIQ